MRKEWIRLNVTLPDSEKVFRLAAALDVPAPFTLGLMARWLTWVDAHCKTEFTGLRPDDVDAVCYGVKGCCEAFAAIGWVQVEKVAFRGGVERVVICEFDKYLSPTSKVRACGAVRKAQCRNKKFED